MNIQTWGRLLWRMAVLLALPGWVAAELHAAGQQEGSVPTEARIARAVADLASEDQAVRDGAVALLKRAGPAAVRALDDAAMDRNPQVADLAARILDFVDYGVDEQTPEDVRRLVRGYRTEEAKFLPVIIRRLAQKGEPGVRALRAIAMSEGAEDVRDQVFGKVADDLERRLQTLLEDRKLLEVEGLLWMAASAGDEERARDLLALLMLGGRLQAAARAIAPWARAAPDRHRAQLLHLVCRAAGDLDAAALAAEATGNNTIATYALAEKGDWAALTRRYAMVAPGVGSRSAALYGLLALFSKLAGQEQIHRSAVQATKGTAANDASQTMQAAGMLLANGLHDDALALLAGDENYLHRAVRLAGLLGRFEEAQRLDARLLARLQERARRGDPSALEAQIELCRHYYLRGGRAEAREALARAARARAADTEPPVLAELAAWQRRLGMDAQADELFTAALSRPLTRNQLRQVAYLAVGGFYGLADVWWQVLRRQRPDEAVPATLRRLAQLFRHEWPAEQFAAVAKRAVEAEPPAMPPDAAGEGEDAGQDAARARLVWFFALGRACEVYGQADLAVRCYEIAAETADTASGLHLGSAGHLMAEHGRWDAAARYFGRAWESDNADAGVLFAQGWAFVKAGRKPEGEGRMELASLLALGKRVRLIRTIERLGLRAQAARERELASVLAPVYAAASGEDQVVLKADRDGDHRRATRMLLAGYLYQLTSGRPVGLETCLWTATCLQEDRAIQGLVDGDLDRALTAARLCMKLNPAGGETAIRLVPIFDRYGHREQADELFEAAWAVGAAICRMYPNDSSEHNRLAWLASRCGRRLDEALAHSKRSLELQPHEPAYMDTLADIHFMRGEIEQAIEWEQKSLRYQTKPFHRQQLNRFRAALAKGAE